MIIYNVTSNVQESIRPMDDLDATQAYSRNFSNWKFISARLVRVLIERMKW
jgi:hypothetical protein